MAVSYVAKAAYTTDDPSVTLGATGDKVVALVFAGNGDGNAITEVTLGGVSPEVFYVAVSPTAGEEAQVAVAMWDHPGAGALTLDITAGAGVRNFISHIWEVSGTSIALEGFGASAFSGGGSGQTLTQKMYAPSGRLALVGFVSADAGISTPSTTDAAANLDQTLASDRTTIQCLSGIDSSTSATEVTYQATVTGGPSGGNYDRHMAVSMQLVEVAGGSTTQLNAPRNGKTFDVLSGSTTTEVTFFAADATDGVTAETGLSTFTVYRDRNGAGASAMTTPTITEVDATNAAGYYTLLLDEDTTIAAGSDFEHQEYYITHSGMAPVHFTAKLVRPKITAGQTLSVTGGDLTNGATGGDGAILTTTITGTPTQTSTSLTFTITDGITNTDALQRCSVRIIDQSDTSQILIGSVKAYTVSAGPVYTIELEPNDFRPLTGFTVAAGDTVKIFQNPTSLADLDAAIQGAVDPAVADLEIITGSDGATLSTSALASIIAAEPGIVAQGTIGATSNTTTTLHLTGLAYADDALIDYLLVIKDDSESLTYARWIDDWVLTTALATVAELPFTPEDSTDSYVILPIRRETALRANAATAATQTTATSIRSAVGMSAANIDTQLSGIATDAGTAATQSTTAATQATSAATQTTASAIRTATGLASANLDTQLSGIATDAESLRKKLVRWTGTVSSIVIPDQSYGVTLTHGADTTIGTYTDHDCFVHDSNGKFKSGPHAMSNSASEGLVAVSASLQVGDRLTVARKVPTIVEINSSTTGTNAATAATEIGKVPRSATAVAAGASVRRTKDAATVSTLDETIGPVP